MEDWWQRGERGRGERGGRGTRKGRRIGGRIGEGMCMIDAFFEMMIDWGDGLVRRMVG